MAFDVKSVWAGAVTDTSVRVIADTAPPTNGTLLVADNEAMTGAASFGPVTATAEGILAFTVTGLDAGTRYWHVVDAGGLNVSYKGTFRTLPGPAGEPASYVFGAAGDAGLIGAGDDTDITSAVSNSPVFTTMAAQSLAEDWVWFSHLGDLHYRNIATNTPSLFRAAYDDTHNYNLGFNPGARQGGFLRGQAITYIWDDHDYGPNDSDRTSASKPAAQQVYRECVPHHALPDAAGIYQSWQAGRVLYIASDVRSFRDPNTDPQAPAKTMLGTVQKAWMEQLLATTGAEALVWQSPSRWLGGTDSWASFLHERDEMVTMFGDLGWLDRMIFLTADEHALGISSGPNNPFGEFPMFMLASMDSNFTTGTDPIYNVGRIGGRRQYGTVRVRDNGHTISLEGTGWIDGSRWKSHTAHVHVGSPVLALDYTGGHISEPFEPTDDDQKTRNDVTATRQDGGEAHVVQDTGTLNIQDPADDPDGIGVYDDAVTLDVAVDEQLPSQAGWRVLHGTVDEARYPLVHVDLAANPTLAAVLTALQGGDRATIDHPPQGLPPDQIQLIADGGTERLGAFDWDVELNASPASPWTVGQLPPGDETTAGPDRPNRLDTSGSALVAAVAALDTELIVHTPPEGVHDRKVWVPGGAVYSGAAATGQGTAVTPDYLVCADADATDIAINDTVQIFDQGGAHKEGTVFTVTAKNSAFGFTNIVFTPNAAEVTMAGDQLRAGEFTGAATEFPFDLRLGGETVRAHRIRPLASDSFTRIVANGWGTSTSGHAWTAVGGLASNRSVDGTRGVITWPSAPDTTRLQTLPDTVGDCEIRVQMSVDQVATGGSMIPSVLLRYAGGTDYYRARLHFGTSGNVFASITRGATAIGAQPQLPYTYTAGQTFEVRVRLIGHRVLMRVWPTSAETEPQTWHKDETVTTTPIATGLVGLTGSAFSSNTNVNPQIRYDNFEITTPQRITVARSLNTVSKGHAAGAPLSLAQPMRVAL